MKQNLRKSAWLLLACFFLLASSVFAGTTGKIAGRVIDEETKQPLAGVAIQIEGTPLGAYTNARGRYSIINIPVGTYIVRATMVGFQTQRITNVQSVIDLTQKVNFSLGKQVLDIGAELTVRAERPLIRKDVTATTEIISTQEIASRARNTVNNVVMSQGGVNLNNTSSSRGSNKDSNSGGLHIRGGRNNEVVYMVDGMSAQDPMFGGFGGAINPNAIKEVVVLVGGFSAEYGNAMSGVVKVVTKGGEDKFTGSLKITTDNVFGRVDDDKYTPKMAYNDSLGIYEPTGSYDPDYDPSSLAFNYTKYEASIGGPIIPQRLSFFLSGEYNDFGCRSPQKEYLPHNSENSYRLQGKVNFAMTSKLKFELSGFYNYRESERYDNEWKYNLDGYLADEHNAYQFKGGINHTLKNNFFYTANFGYFHTETQTGTKPEWDAAWNTTPADDMPWGQPGNHEDKTYGEPGTRFANTFVISGDYPLWRDFSSEYIGAKVDFQWDITETNNFRFGFDSQFHTLDYYERYLTTSPEPFADEWDANPTNFAAYVQDKVEFEGMIVNAGFRLDYLDTDGETYINPLEPDEGTRSNDAKIEISPRIGISHPISDQSVLYFNYGHFYQPPAYKYMFEHNLMEINRGNTLIGDPDMDMEKTIAYEIGIDRSFADIYKLSVTAFAKKVENLVGTRLVRNLPDNYVEYVSEDYGLIKGMEIKVRKAPSNYVSGYLAYSYQMSKGTSSSQRDAYYRVITESASDARGIPNKEYYLEFDRTHTVSANVDFRIPDDEMGFLENSGLNVTFSAASGAPYTPEDAAGNQVGEPFSARMPWTHQTDMRLNKDFKFGQFATSFFITGINVFNAQNIVGVYPKTGEPDNDGQNFGSSSEEYIAGQKELYWQDPQMWDTPRRILVGMEISF